MLRPVRYAIPGYVKPGYLAAWSPPAGLKHVNHALSSFDLTRMPSYPEYSIAFEQWAAESGGGVLFTGQPYTVRIFQSLSWRSMPAADLAALETFYRTVARAQSEQWTWWNPICGMSLPVRFADPVFPEATEVAKGYHRLNGLRLMHDINYPGSVPSGSPNYSASMGTALSIGSVVMRFPTPVKPATGYSLETRYVAEDSSAGLPVVQRVGSAARRRWSLSWDGNLQHIHWIRLQAFFCTFVRGRQEPFTWFDADGTARTVRLAENRFVVKQLGYNRYSCTLPLLEYL